MWRCLSCRAEIENGFEVCWSCGTSIDGEADPHFGREEEPDTDDSPTGAGRLVTVASFSTSPQAHACKLRLEAAGVRAYLADDNLIAMDWLLSNAIGGVKVQVADADVARARTVLARP
jgi:hypothetical protein